MRALVCFLLLSFVLAGCAESDPTTEAPDEPVPEGTTVTEETGAIAGVVVDQAIVPLVGITVRLQEPPLETVTDEDGAFAFSELEPGTYFITAEGDRYPAQQTSVTVEAGEISRTRISLQITSSPAPYHYSVKHDGFIDVSGALVGNLVNIVVREVVGDDPTCDCGMEFTTIGEDVQTLVVEAFWESSVTDPNPVCPECLYLEVFPATLDDGTADIQGGFLPNPIHEHYPYALWDDDGTETNEEWTANLSGSAYWPNLQQDYELFVTVFVNEAAPDGWTINT